MLNKEDITKLVKLIGGVGVVAAKTGLRENTIYRLMNGVNKPRYDTLLKLKGLNDEIINN
jgi:DNA-binding phage protein